MDLYCTDPTQYLVPAGQDLDDLDRDLYDMSELDDLDRGLPVMCGNFGLDLARNIWVSTRYSINSTAQDTL